VNAVSKAFRGALGRMAGELSTARCASPAAGSAAGADDSTRTEAGPTVADAHCDDLLDRERQLRVLMSSWM
jgi:hypothetical protein